MPPSTSRLALLLLLSLLALVSRGPSLVGGVIVQGTSTSEVNYAFPNTLAHYELSNPGVQFNTPLGPSVSNVLAQLAGHVDFALTMAPLTPAQAAANPNITSLPIMAASFVPVYRLDALNASTTLIFSGRTLALIHAGNVTNWSDPLIALDNPGVVLPNQNITVVFLNSSRRFNYVLLTAFGKFEPSIAAVLPPSNLPAWPTNRYAASIGVKGVSGTSAEVVDVDGAVSVDSSNYATYMQATVGAMYNSRGNVVTATDTGLSLYFTMAELLTATATNVTSFADLTDCQTAHCWPIACATYLLLDTYSSPHGCEVRGAVVDFLLWYFQQTVVVERMLTDYGLQSLSDELQEPLNVPDTLAAITCWGQPVGSTVAADVYDVVGTDRLLPLLNMVVDLHAIADSSVDFEYVGATSTAAMLQGQSTLGLAVLYNAEVNRTTTPIDFERFVLLPTFLTSVIVTFNTQLSPTVRLNASELVIDVRTLALIVLGNISDWADPRLLALNQETLGAVLDGQPAPIRLIHGCSTLDPAASTAPLLTSLYSFLIASLGDDPAVLSYVSSPAGAQALATLFACTQAANTGRFSNWLYVSSDNTISTLVSNRPGSVGYAMDGNSAEGAGASIGTFSILMSAMVNGESMDTIRRSSPAALAACAAAGRLDGRTLELDVTAAWSEPNCWPLTQVVYMQIPRDYPSRSYSMGVATVNLLHWIYSTAALDVWSNQNMLVRTATVPAVQSVLLTTLDTITSSGTTVLVLPNVWQLTPAIAYAAYAVQALGWLISLFFIAVTVRYRSHATLRSASPLFMVVSLVGVMLLFGGILALVTTPSSSSCIAFSWLIQLGFTVTFAPLFAKAYRIYRIFGRRKLHVVRISNSKLLAAVTATILLDVVLLAVWHSIAPPTVATIVQQVTSTTGAVQDNDYAQCTWSGVSARFMGVECALKVVALCVGVMLAFSTRQVTDRFNDSKSISLSIYNLVFALVVILPILVLVDAVGNVRILLLLFCITEIGLVTLGVLFVPKLLSFLASYNSVAPGQHTQQSVHQSSDGGFSFLSIEQLRSLPHLTVYIAALVRHIEEAKRIHAGRRGAKSIVSSGNSKHRDSASPPDTARRQQLDSARRAVEADINKKGVWAKNPHSRVVSPTSAMSRQYQAIKLAKTASSASTAGAARVHSRGESGGQDKDVDAAVQDAGVAGAVSPRSAAARLALATSPRAVEPLVDVEESGELQVSSLDTSMVKPVNAQPVTTPV